MTTQEIIRSFLGLPATSMPAASWIDGMDDSGSAWPHIRDFVRPLAVQQLNHLGETVRLTADREGWREGVTVVLS